MNIYQKLVEIRKAIDVFTKDTKGHGYSYVSGAQVLKKIKDKMDELQVILIPHVLDQHHEKHEYKTSKGVEKIDFIVTANMKYVWINADEPSEKVEIQWQTLGQQDDISKAFGSGLTYSERYFLLKFFGVPTDEDDPDSKDTSGRQPNNSQNKASEKQLNLIDKLLNETAQTKNITKDVAYQTLKQRLQTNIELENFTSSMASQAIAILNEAKKGNKSA